MPAEHRLLSIATNSTFKEIAVERGGMDPERVYIVRSIPNVQKFRRVEPNRALRNGRRHLIGYVGIMGAQDGVDLLVEAMDRIVNRDGRRDVQCAIIGSGTELEGLRRLAAKRGLENYVTFTGFLSGEALLSALSAFDMGVIPDPKNSYNDKISMNKVFEYMTLGLPFVQFDLVEGRKVAADASLYAQECSADGLAVELTRLCDDEALRARLAEVGQKRAKALLNWDTERGQLLAAYDTALAPKRGAVDAVLSR